MFKVNRLEVRQDLDKVYIFGVPQILIVRDQVAETEFSHILMKIAEKKISNILLPDAVNRIMPYIKVDHHNKYIKLDIVYSHSAARAGLRFNQVKIKS